MEAEPTVRELPILFSGLMVNAILAGRKTQTRRVMKPQPNAGPRGRMVPLGDDAWGLRDGDLSGEWRCPYGEPGTRLWVRETWQYADWTEDGMPWVRYRADDATVLHERTPEEWGDRLTDIWADLSAPANYDIDSRAADRRWRPAIHIPRWASRITLEVTRVRIERLDDIGAGDAHAEGGCTTPPVNHAPWIGCRQDFRALWEAINGKRPGCSWDANPWVWVVEFRRLTPEHGP